MTFVYPLSYTGGKRCPVSSLDHVLYKRIEPKVSYYCPSTGNLFTLSSYLLACENAKNKVYPGTDHTPFSFEVGGLKVLYVSLDNSVRATQAGHSLISRLDRICEIVTKISPDIVFYSEACRKNPTSWLEVRRIISKQTSMTFLLECANNFSENQMSFGVACFGREDVLNKVESVQAHQLLQQDKTFYGSGSVVLTLKTGEVIVGVHFPLDFVKTGKDNNNSRALTSLIELLEKYEIAYGIGDMNSIPGVINESMDEIIKETEWKLTQSQPTFFPSYFDFLPQTDEIQTIELTSKVATFFATS